MCVVAMQQQQQQLLLLLLVLLAAAAAAVVVVIVDRKDRCGKAAGEGGGGVCACQRPCVRVASSATHARGWTTRGYGPTRRPDRGPDRAGSPRC